jgi:hypothetical protein
MHNGLLLTTFKHKKETISGKNGNPMLFGLRRWRTEKTERTERTERTGGGGEDGFWAGGMPPALPTVL